MMDDTYRQIIYKQVRMPVAHCGLCKERLVGNGSPASPYECSCGEWEYQQSVSEDDMFALGFYRIK